MVEEESCSSWQLIPLVSSLLSLSHSTKVFQVKWQLIRNELQELNTSLIAAQNYDLDEDSSFWELTPAILLTVTDCYDLVHRCVNLTYSGKLLMQSDLDVVISRFGVHLKCLDQIYNAGLVSQTHQMIVVSRPSLGASRDDIKFYIMDLLTRLKIGDFVMKNQALVALNEVIEEDDRYVKMVVETNGFISVLTSFLDAADSGIQEEAAKVVSVIAELYSSTSAVLVSPLLQVLEKASDLGKERAAIALRMLTENSNNAWSICAQGGVTALIRICSNGDSKGELKGAACGILKNIVEVEEIKRFMVEQGAIPTFIKLMGSTDEASSINAIEFLQVMASENDSIRQMVIRGGGIHSLVQVLDPKVSFSSKTQEVAFRAIDTFCFSSRNSLVTLLDYGFLDTLLFYLRSHQVSHQEVALKATFRLCNTSEEVKGAMGDKDFMSELMRLLGTQETAVEALASMLCVSRNRRKFVHEDDNVSRLLQLLEDKFSNKRLLVSIIMSITSCHRGRRKISKSIYVKNLEKLAEAGVMDAKRITKRLSANKFQSICCC